MAEWGCCPASAYDFDLVDTRYRFANGDLLQRDDSVVREIRGQFPA